MATKYLPQFFLALSIGFLIFTLVQSNNKLDQRFEELEAKIIQEDHQHIEINLILHEIKVLEEHIKELEVAHQQFTDKDINLDWQLKAIEERVVELQRRLSP